MTNNASIILRWFI